MQRISEKMRGQIRGLNMAQKNAQDGISVNQTAEGALNEVHELLQRGRELAVQAANDTNVGSDREAIQLEINSIKKEIDRIGTDTEFNTLKILQGTGTQGLSGEQLDKLTDQVKLFLEGSEKAVKNAYGIGPGASIKDITMNFVAKDNGNTLAWVTSYVNTVTGISQEWEMTFDTMDFTGDSAQETDLALTTLHEMTHAMMSASGINWKDTHNPKWFKEGTAEYMTGSMGRLVNDLKIQGGITNFDSDANILSMLNRVDGASSFSLLFS